ncbi:hypothetical protein [Antrihabitans cavernicola]|uniref:SCO6045-like C-terminal domain-containing protein n=1 Tax=Antrihabitans cavernicola TaxID=2495913 RepID=A0A5A7SK15_9NOCA|nr:hypothetical protein [Spelaeibacter cavernicola]KAA0025003.1 hypothetical protein FOY51_03565 [Spelaeibacter cavernicola]
MTLAEQQAAVVRALVAGGEPPSGFDIAALSATSEALLRKRAGEVAQHDPMLRHWCGDNYRSLFLAWATDRPKVSTHADAAAFRAHLTETGVLVRRRWWQRTR